MIIMVHRRLLPLSILLLTLVNLSSSVEHLKHVDPLFSGDSVEELLGLCSELQKEDMIFVPGQKFLQCPNGTICIKFCNEDRLNKLRDAQFRIKTMLSTLEQLDRTAMQLAMFFSVFILGTYLVCVGHFNKRTLPWSGYKFEDDATDGYRYSHYIWMDWIILDSNHPTYYVNMIPDAQELEYIAQNREWKPPELEKRAGEGRPVWSIKHLYAMTSDPHERLETYFRMVEYQI